MTYQEAKDLLLQLIDKYSERGEKKSMSDANVADYAWKIPSFLDLAQKQISAIHPVRKEYRISQYIPTRHIYLDAITHESDAIDFSLDGIKAVTFAVDGKADVKIGYIHDGTFFESDDLSTGASGGFTTVKAFVPTVSGMSLILRFTGDYYYTIKNVGLFAATFESQDKIPAISPYIEYKMPSSFMFAFKVEVLTPNGRAVLDDFSWSADGRTIGIPVSLRGEVIIAYASESETIDQSTEMSYVFEIAPTLQGAMCYYAASAMLMNERPDTSSILMQMYQEKMLNYSEHRLLQTRIKKK